MLVGAQNSWQGGNESGCGRVDKKKKNGCADSGSGVLERGGLSGQFSGHEQIAYTKRTASIARRKRTPPFPSTLTGRMRLLQFVNNWGSEKGGGRPAGKYRYIPAKFYPQGERGGLKLRKEESSG